MKLIFPERLKYLRTDKSLTQKELGKALGVEENTVCGWEQGNRTPDIYMLADIAQYFGVTVEALIGITEL